MSTLLDAQIDSIERYVIARQLRIAEHLAAAFESGDVGNPLSESGFAILSVVLSYFEMIAQFETGSSSHNQNATYFVRGFRSVYPTTTLPDAEIREVYGWARCGMYHGAMPKNETGLSRHLTVAFEKTSSYLVINPAQLVRDIRQHFERHMARLRNPACTSERCCFQAYFASLQAPSSPKTSVSPSPRRGKTGKDLKYLGISREMDVY